MQVAQLPDSQENGGDMPIWRACLEDRRARVIVGRLGASAYLDRHTGGRIGYTGRLRLRQPLLGSEPFYVDPRSSTPPASNVCSTTSMKGPGPHT